MSVCVELSSDLSRHVCVAVDQNVQEATDLLDVQDALTLVLDQFNANLKYVFETNQTHVQSVTHGP